MLLHLSYPNFILFCFISFYFTFPLCIPVWFHFHTILFIFIVGVILFHPTSLFYHNPICNPILLYLFYCDSYWSQINFVYFAWIMLAAPPFFSNQDSVCVYKYAGGAAFIWNINPFC
jgi:hypothetical protein